MLFWQTLSHMITEVVFVITLPIKCPKELLKTTLTTSLKDTLWILLDNFEIMKPVITTT